MTKTYTTSQVVRILEKHASDCPAWIFEAPETDGEFEQRATGYYAFVLFEERDTNGEWGNDYRPCFRNDWVRVNPPPRKRTRSDLLPYQVKPYL